MLVPQTSGLFLQALKLIKIFCTSGKVLQPLWHGTRLQHCGAVGFSFEHRRWATETALTAFGQMRLKQAYFASKGRPQQGLKRSFQDLTANYVWDLSVGLSLLSCYQYTPQVVFQTLRSLCGWASPCSIPWGLSIRNAFHRQGNFPIKQRFSPYKGRSTVGPAGQGE